MLSCDARCNGILSLAPRAPNNRQSSPNSWAFTQKGAIASQWEAAIRYSHTGMTVNVSQEWFKWQCVSQSRCGRGPHCQQQFTADEAISAAYIGQHKHGWRSCLDKQELFLQHIAAAHGRALSAPGGRQLKLALMSFVDGALKSCWACKRPGAESDQLDLQLGLHLA